MKKSNSKVVVLIVIVVWLLLTAAIAVYSSRKVLWLSNNEKEFDVLIDDIKIMRGFPIDSIHYQDGDISSINVRCDYSTGEYYIVSDLDDGSEGASEEKVLIDYEEYTRMEEEAELKITDDINRIKSGIWTGDEHLLSGINAYWDQNGKIIVYINMAQKELRNTEKVLASTYVYIEDGFSRLSVEPKGRLKKLKGNWYLEEHKADVG